MKKLSYILLLFILITACNPKIANTPETLDKIFTKRSFKLQIQVFGCFRDNLVLLKVKRTDKNYIITSSKTNKSIPATQNQLDSLKSYLNERLFSIKKEKGFCTGGMILTVGNYFDRIKFENSTCGRDWKKLKDMLHLNEVINEN